MPTITLTGGLWTEMLKSGAHNLRNNAKIVNDLNVFPIPDGDTGENMSLTIEGGVKAMDAQAESLSLVGCQMARGMLLNARGNSGVILSQFFGGIGKAFDGLNEATIEQMKLAFIAGVKKAYESVLQPTEGTILTVVREATECATENVSNDDTFEAFFACFIREAHASLKRTPDLLPVLKEAGVIDSGGAGLIYIIEGMDAALNGRSIEAGDEATTPKAALNESQNMSFDENSELTFGYCTECLLQLQNKKTDIEAFDEKKMIAHLETLGNSIVCVKAGSIVKLHIHTMTPGEVFNYCQQFGEFLTLKVENMNIQHSETTIANNYSDDYSEKQEEKKKVPHKNVAIVTVANGEGIANTFSELGADEIVSGGQTMNPSAESFIEAFDRLNADHIVVMPNNSNIILTARQAAEMYDKAKVWVLESKTIGDGYAALSMYDPDAGSIEQIMNDFNSAMNDVSTGLVSMSVRDSSMSGLDIHEGEYIGIEGKEILSNHESLLEASKLLLDKMHLEDCSVLICVKGKDATDDELNAIISATQSAYSNLEVYPLEGGQDVYPFIFIAEA